MYKQTIPAFVNGDENLGNLIVREKNKMLAKDHKGALDTIIPLLITKEVFIVSKEALNCKGAFTKTYLFGEVPTCSNDYAWPFELDQNVSEGYGIGLHIREKTIEEPRD